MDVDVTVDSCRLAGSTPKARTPLVVPDRLSDVHALEQ